ncbi:ABC transporter substrate-binding protein [Bordetella ansorpii]|uniref:ABC transporter substrate-binding protein n=1 Tax=Bordetella ansorpii TaxID=288768 RepID=A0A157PM35_9BORD|nr:extracellular solute-binding protein [Bordetella ansorpii]SAI34424.1 ABC transporter substrate-binding protein [Bordetella ansorpii]
MPHLTRRQLLCAAMAGAAFPGLSFAARQQLVVGTWGGDFGNILKASVDDALMEPKGIEVVQSIGAPMQRRAKLLAERNSRRGSMDVACLADFDIHAAAGMNALAPVNEDTVARTRHVLPFLKKSHAIPHIYSAYVIVYNTDMVKTPPTSFADLWDPKWRGRVGLCDFQYTTNTAIAAIVGGGSMSNFAPAQAKLDEMKALDAKVLPSTEAVAVALKSGEIWFTIIAAARAYMWRKQGVPVARIVPSEGGIPTSYEAAVPANTRQKELAYGYLDAMLSPSAQSAFASRMGYLPTVDDVKLPEELEREINFTTQQREKMMQLDLDYLQQNQASILDAWNKTFKG